LLHLPTYFIPWAIPYIKYSHSNTPYPNPSPSFQPLIISAFCYPPDCLVNIPIQLTTPPPYHFLNNISQAKPLTIETNSHLLSRQTASFKTSYCNPISKNYLIPSTTSTSSAPIHNTLPPSTASSSITPFLTILTFTHHANIHIRLPKNLKPNNPSSLHLLLLSREPNRHPNLTNTLTIDSQSRGPTPANELESLEFKDSENYGIGNGIEKKSRLWGEERFFWTLANCCVCKKGA